MMPQDVSILQAADAFLDVSVLQHHVLPLDLSVLHQLVALYCLRTCLSYSSLQYAASGRIDSATADAFLDVPVLQHHVQLCTSLFCAASGCVSFQAACAASGLSVHATATCAASTGYLNSSLCCFWTCHICSTAASPLDVSVLLQ
jgi:hypothetical protein